MKIIQNIRIQNYSLRTTCNTLLSTFSVWFNWTDRCNWWRLKRHTALDQQAAWPPGSADTVCPRPPLTLTFDRLTLKLVCESPLRWGTLLPNLGTLGLLVLELFAMYATDGQTDGRTDGQKQRLLPPLCGREHNNSYLLPCIKSRFSYCARFFNFVVSVWFNWTDRCDWSKSNIISE